MTSKYNKKLKNIFYTITLQDEENKCISSAIRRKMTNNYSQKSLSIRMWNEDVYFLLFPFFLGQNKGEDNNTK